MIRKQVLAISFAAILFVGLQVSCVRSPGDSIPASTATSSLTPTPILSTAVSPAPELTATPQPAQDESLLLFLNLLLLNKDAIILAETDGVYEVSPASIEKSVVVNDVDCDGFPELIFISGTGDPFHPYALSIYDNSGKQISLNRDVWGVDNYCLFTTTNNTICLLELQSNTAGVFALSCFEYAINERKLVQVNKTSHEISLPEKKELFVHDWNAISRDEYHQIVCSYIASLRQLLIDQGLESSVIWWQEETAKYFDDSSVSMWLRIFDVDSIALPFEKSVNYLRGHGNSSSAFS